MKSKYKMNLALVTILIVMIGSTAEAGITTKTIVYEDQGQSLQGYLATTMRSRADDRPYWWFMSGGG